MLRMMGLAVAIFFGTVDFRYLIIFSFLTRDLPVYSDHDSHDKMGDLAVVGSIYVQINKSVKRVSNIIILMKATWNS